jgi:hypothetical protein
MIKKVLLAVGLAIVGAGLTVMAAKLREQKPDTEEIMAVETAVRDKKPTVVKSTSPTVVEK